MFDHRMTRRESLHTLLKLTGTAAVAAAGLWPSTARSASQQRRFLIEAVTKSEKASVAILASAAGNSNNGQRAAPASVKHPDHFKSLRMDCLRVIG